MVKKFVIAILCFASHGVFAQNSTVSPYSFFGIGDLRSASTVENQMMGRLGMYTDSIHINLQNPAAYGKLRLSTYTAGISHKEIRLESFTEQQNSSVTNLEYLSLAFPVSNRFGVGIGIVPYSSVGYNILGESTNSNQAMVTNEYAGVGGINKLYLSMGFTLVKDLALGATVNYNFGTLENSRVQSVEGIQFGTLDERISRVNGYDFNYGATYTPSIKDKYTFFSSLVVNTQVNLVSENTQRIGSFSQSSNLEIEVLEVNLAAQGLRNTELKIPTITTIGLGFGEDKKWFMGAEYSLQALSSFSNEFLSVENMTYDDASSLAFGAFYVPDYASFTSFFKRVTYRAGVRLDKTGIRVNDREINNFGITFGLGLPLGGGFSNLNLGFELGRRGTTVANLIEESYLKVNLGLSFNDRWFRKRQID